MNGKLIIFIVFLSGVAGTIGVFLGLGGGRMGDESPLINHVVFIKLEDSDDADSLMDDCDRLLPGIPGVVGYWCGEHGDYGRTTVDKDYDVALYVGFMSGDGYATYVDHENHVELVERWKPKFEWIRVYDVVSRNQRQTDGYTE